MLDATRLPLADLLRAVADWLDDDPTDLPEPDDDEPKPKWVANDRGGFDPAD